MNSILKQISENKQLLEKMKYLILILYSSFLLACSSNTNLDYKVVDKTIINESECRINYRYPQIEGNDRSNTNLIDLNKLLKTIGEYDRYISLCDSSSPRYMKSFVSYDCDYKILLQTDSILSIEIFGTTYYENGYKYLRYNSFLVNSNNWKILKLEDVISDFDRGLIYPYIEKYVKETGNHINLLAYKSGSNYVITYGLTKDNLIIYVGGEGEWFGNDRVEIPLKELKKL